MILTLMWHALSRMIWLLIYQDHAVFKVVSRKVMSAHHLDCPNATLRMGAKISTPPALPSWFPVASLLLATKALPSYPSLWSQTTCPLSPMCHSWTPPPPPCIVEVVWSGNECITFCWLTVTQSSTIVTVSTVLKTEYVPQPNKRSDFRPYCFLLLGSCPFLQCAVPCRDGGRVTMSLTKPYALNKGTHNQLYSL